MMIKFFKTACLVVLFFSSIAASNEVPSIMRGKKYTADVVVGDYFVSEKMDGVRARWNGKQLISRNGNVFAAPAWFIRDFPANELDGELWLGRGKYQQTVSVVSRQTVHKGWRELTFMVFDLPDSSEPFIERYAQLAAINEVPKSAYLRVIPQQRLLNNRQLMLLFDRVISGGGEGLMLHHKDSMYVNGRSAHLLKLKQFDDAEALVVGYKPGNGKYSGMVGSLKVRMENGQEFYVGSGLTDKQRAEPPTIGRRITFRHQGFTDSGLPRFPVYLRQRLIE